MCFSLALNVGKIVIGVNDNKDVKLFYQDLVYVILKYSRYIGHAKRHYLVLKVIVMGLAGCLLFIAFLDPHPMIGIGLDETSSLIQSIE